MAKNEKLVNEVVEVEVGKKVKENKQFRIYSLPVQALLTEDEREYADVLKEINVMINAIHSRQKLKFEYKNRDGEVVEQFTRGEFKFKTVIKGKETDYKINVTELAKKCDEMIAGYLSKLSDIKKKYSSDEAIKAKEDDLEEYLSKIERGKKTKARKEFEKAKSTEKKCEINSLKDGLIANNGLLDKLNEHKKVLIDKIKIESVGNKDVRTVNDSYLHIAKNRIMMDDSSLSRAMDIKYQIENISDELMIITVKSDDYYIVMEQILNKGFKFNDKEYIYFSSSAGQIRNRKLTFIKKATYDTIKNKILCGVDESSLVFNQNKFLAYKSLCGSSTTPISGFDIDKCIVVSDIEKKYTGEFDCIDTLGETESKVRMTKNKETGEMEPKLFKNKQTGEMEKRYTKSKITTGTMNIERREETVDINRVDGLGWALESPENDKRNFMFRAPFFKGLMNVVDYKSFIKEYCVNGKVVDMWGKEHDIIEEDIQYIFTASQFKLHKIYTKMAEANEKYGKENTWQIYKDLFKKYECEASYTNIERKSFKSVNLSYQALQNIKKFTKNDLKELTELTYSNIDRIETDFEMRLKLLGASSQNEKKNYKQRAIAYYPALMKEESSIRMIKNTRNKMIRLAKFGKINLGSIMNFIIPDPVWCMSELFNVKEGVEVPVLEEKQVKCRLFKAGKAVLNRYPVLYSEHYVCDNVVADKSNKFNKYYDSDAIYVNCKDSLSLLIMCDYDGDMALMTQNKTFTKLIEDNLTDVVPLFYNMVKAGDVKITSKTTYKSLHRAFKNSAAIGINSNKISKIWNRKEYDVETIKRITSLNNFSIDAAKTNFTISMSAKLVDKEIKKMYDDATKDIKYPYFFRYKDSKNTYIYLDKDTDELTQKIAKRNGKKLVQKKLKTNFVDRLEDYFDFKKLEIYDAEGEKLDFKWENLKANRSRRIDNKKLDVIAEAWGALIKNINKEEKNINNDKCSDSTSEESKETTYKDKLRSIYTDELKKFEEAISVTKLSKEEYIDYILAIHYKKGMEKTRKDNKIKSRGIDYMWDMFGEILYNNIKSNVEPVVSREVKAKCERCEADYIKRSNRAKYCSHCATVKKKKAKAASKKRIKKGEL